jgi:glycosyltransferase involved in cell wall biosynthesis
MSYTKKPRIISIMPHGPAYDFSPDEKPDVWWEKTDGSWLGFWTREWPDLLGEAVLKQTGKYEWEVWQPDYRADRIYSKTLETGVTHRLFPARDKTFRAGVGIRKGIFSETVIVHLRKFQNHPIILMLNGTYGVHLPLYNEIIKAFGPTKKFPILFIGHGMFKAPISEMLELHRPLTYLDLVVEHFMLKNRLRYIDIIFEQAESALKEVSKVYSGRIEKFTMGCDFDFWRPVSSAELKKSIRTELNISQERIAFLASGNFIPRKQFVKLIEVFNTIQKRNDFFIVIVGHGNETYTKMLKSLAEPLIEQGKALLHPYVRGERLRDIYWASDLYISVATDEGGPVTVMEAMGCGLPVLSTPVGETTERMKKHRVGSFISVKKYDEWAAAIESLLNNGLPKALDIQTARKAYHRENVAKRFINIYQDLYKSYF